MVETNIVSGQVQAAPLKDDAVKKPVAKEKASGPLIKWTGASAGVATARVISTSHWGQLGIADCGTVEFNMKNNFCVEENSLNAEQIDYLLKTDGYFVRVDGDGNPLKDGDA